MTPLTDAEATAFHRIVFGGTGNYPLKKLANGDWVSSPIISKARYPTKGEAIRAVEAWTEDATARWRAMRAEHPEISIDERGIHYLKETA